MLRIESEEAATRLAKAIVSDVRLYHEERIARGEDVSDAVQEGRELFRSRVGPELHSVFERAVVEMRLIKSTAPAHAAPDGTLAPVERLGSNEPLPPGLFREAAAQNRSSRSALWVAFAVLLVAAGFGFWLSSR